MTVTPETPNRRLDADSSQRIVASLRAIIRRMRLLVLVRGLAAVTAAVLGMLLIVMGIDSLLLIESVTGRWGLLLAVVVPVVMVAVRMLVRPLARSFTYRGMARMLESHHPEFQERISSAIELLNSHDDASLRGSEALIAILVQQAGEAAGGLRPKREASVRLLPACLVAAAITGAVVVALFVKWPDQTAQMIVRALVPGSEMANLPGANLVCTPSSPFGEIPEGYRQRVDVEAVGIEADTGEIRMIMPDGKRVTAPMSRVKDSPAGNPQFTVRCPPAYGTFSYDVRVGRAISRRYTRTVVKRADLKRIDLRYVYPQYTGRQSETQHDAPGRIRALVGTRVELTLTAEAPVAEARLLLNDIAMPEAATQPASAASSPADAKARTFAFDLVKDPKTNAFPARWAVEITQRLDGIDYVRVSRSFEIEALSDAVPVVKLLAPTVNALTLNATDRVPVRFGASDDMAVTDTVLMLNVDGKVQAEIPIEVDGAPGESVSGQAELDLAKLCPSGAGRIVFRIRARDNLPVALGGPGIGFSDECTVTISRAAQAYTVQRRVKDALRIRALLTQLLGELKSGHADAGDLREALPKMDVMTLEAIQRADHLRQQTAASAKTIGKLREAIADYEGGVLREGIEELTATIEGADHGAGILRLTEARKVRIELAGRIEKELAKGIEVTNRLLQELVGMDWVLANIEVLTALSARQEALAAKLALDPKNKALLAEQDRIAKEIEKLIAGNQAAQKAQIAKHSNRMQDIIKKLSSMRAVEAEMAKYASQLKRPGPKQSAKMTPEMAAAEAARLQKEQAELAKKMGQLAKQLGRQPAARTAAQAATKEATAAARQAGMINPKNPSSAAPAAQMAATAAKQMQQAAQALKQSAAAGAAKPGGGAGKPGGAGAGKPGGAGAGKPGGGGAGKPGGGGAGKPGGGGAGKPGGGGAGKPGGGGAGKPGGGGEGKPGGGLGPKATNYYGMFLDPAELQEMAEALLARQLSLAAQFKAFAENHGVELMAARQKQARGDTLRLKEETEAMYRESYAIAGGISSKVRSSLQKSISSQFIAQQMYQKPQEANLAELAALHDKAVGGADHALMSLYEPAGRVGGRGANLPDSPEGQMLSDAFDAAQQAVQPGRSSRAAKASNMLRTLSQGGMARIAGVGLVPGKPGKPPKEGGPGGAGAMEVDLAKTELGELGQRLMDWERISSELKGDAMQGLSDSVPSEYELLIKRYFEALARRGAARAKEPGK